ncbi:hypothetical protein E4188_22865 (plasmid) [Aeromonas media]|uniref:Uncharacterized protein n=1 Tax=Aeromonas media TaxID=651 RepID=A0ABX6NY73_AERME|nr:hypothetical protein [Aeromonas media]QJT37060.1 hypothetical protein E4187_22475 [Aeromonas media]QJT41341.1 hypothetical protein E4188_22865 [Aeromonas media]HDT5862687.1 hypothetical protein [Aeromonas hydrophila subsp. hydrophila]
MAYASLLPEDKFAEIYDQLEERVAAAATAAYNMAIAKAKTRKQRIACAGHYPSDWSRLMGLWCQDKVSNLMVQDCLRVGSVYSPGELDFILSRSADTAA